MGATPTSSAAPLCGVVQKYVFGILLILQLFENIPDAGVNIDKEKVVSQTHMFTLLSGSISK